MRPNPFFAQVGPSMVEIGDIICGRAGWNIGYQMQKYRADFSPALSFTANTGFTSLLWTPGAAGRAGAGKFV